METTKTVLSFTVKNVTFNEDETYTVELSSEEFSNMMQETDIADITRERGEDVLDYMGETQVMGYFGIDYDDDYEDEDYDEDEEFDSEGEDGTKGNEIN